MQPDARRTRDLLADSIERQAQITLTHRYFEGWRQFKSAFVATARGGELILIQAPLMDSTDAVGLPPVGSTLGVNFRVGHKKCMFETVRMPDLAEHGGIALTRSEPGDARAGGRERGAP